MTKRKQVILLMTDTTRFDMLGCYGNSGMKTPTLDALAEDGIRFEHAYTCQPVCGPARSAIFTGTFPHSCGGFTNSYALGISNEFAADTAEISVRDGVLLVMTAYCPKE